MSLIYEENFHKIEEILENRRKNPPTKEKKNKIIVVPDDLKKDLL